MAMLKLLSGSGTKLKNNLLTWVRTPKIQLATQEVDIFLDLSTSEATSKNYDNVFKLISIFQETLSETHNLNLIAESQTFLTKFEELYKIIHASQEQQALEITKQIFEVVSTLADSLNNLKTGFASFLFADLLDVIKSTESKYSSVPRLQLTAALTFDSLLNNSKANLIFLKETFNLESEISSLANTLLLAEEFSFQTVLIEIIFRIIKYPKSGLLQENYHTLFNTWPPFLVAELNKITIPQFAQESRIFLNILNQNQKRVYSLFATSVSINGKAFPEVWVHFGIEEAFLSVGENETSVYLRYRKIVKCDFDAKSGLKLSINTVLPPDLKLPLSLDSLTKVEISVKKEDYEMVADQIVPRLTPKMEKVINLQQTETKSHHISVHPPPQTEQRTPIIRPTNFIPKSAPQDSNRKRRAPALIPESTKRPRPRGIFEDDDDDGDISKVLLNLSHAIENKLSSENQKLSDKATHTFNQLEAKLEKCVHQQDVDIAEVKSYFKKAIKEHDNQIQEHVEKAKNAYDELRKEILAINLLDKRTADLRNRFEESMNFIKKNVDKEINTIENDGLNEIFQLKTLIEKRKKNQKSVQDFVSSINHLEMTLDASK